MALPAKKTVGDLIRASDMNRLIDVAGTNERNVAQILRKLTRGKFPFESAHKIQVYNNTGAEIAMFGIYGIKEQVFTADAVELMTRTLEVEAPALADHIGKWVVLAEQIPDGGIGKAYVSGMCLCKINIVSTAHRFAEIADADEEKLVSAYIGTAKIIWAEAGTGTKWAVIEFPAPSRTGVAKLQANIAAGASGNVKLCNLAGTETGAAFSARNIGPGDAVTGNLVVLTEGEYSVPFFAYSVPGLPIAPAFASVAGIRPANPDTTYPGDFDVEAVAGAVTKSAIWKFPTPIPTNDVNGLVAANTTNSQTIVQDNDVSGFQRQKSAELQWSQIDADFNLAAVTWNNQPSYHISDSVELEADGTANGNMHAQLLKGGILDRWGFAFSLNVGTGGKTYYGIKLEWTTFTPAALDLARYKGGALLIVPTFP